MKSTSNNEFSTTVFLHASTVLGIAALGLGLFPYVFTDVWKFVCHLSLAVLSACFRISLPTITGTLTINFLFILIGVAEFSLSEVLVIATAMTGLQCVLAQDRRPTTSKILFNVAVVALATTGTYLVYWDPRFAQAGIPVAVRQVTAAFVLYVMTTFPISIAIALTERRSIVRTWRECSLWTGPYYLAGAAVVILLSATTRMLGWQMVLFVMPVAYLITRSYQLYAGRIEDGLKHMQQMADLHLRTIESLALAIEAKDTTTHDHLQRVQVYAIEIAKRLDLPEEQIEALRAAALLHDIGKLAVPEHIISKPGRLTPEEFEKMKVHPIVGAEIIEQARFPYPVAPIVRSHHERWDGEGYPDGLAGEAIPIGARILSVVDCFDALSQDRQYRRGLPVSEALAMIAQDAGRSFDPEIVRILAENYLELEEMARLRLPARTRLSTEVRVERGLGPAAGYERENQETRPIGEARGPFDLLQSVASARQEVESLVELSEDLASSLSLSEKLGMMAERLERIVPYDSMALYAVRDGKLVCQFVTGANSRLFRSLEMPVGQGLSGWVAESKQPILNGNPSVEPGYLKDPSKFSTLRSALAVPLLNDKQRAVGVLTLYASERDFFTGDHLRVLLSLSGKLAQCLAHARTQELVETGATTDCQTMLPTARGLVAQMNAEIARCERTGGGFEILVCGLNGINQVRDRIGHLEANRVVQQFSTLLEECRRTGELVARMGEGEFALLLPARSAQGLDEKILQLHDFAREAGQVLADEAMLSVAVGTAAYPVDGQEAERLLAMADERMSLEKAATKLSLSGRPARRLVASPLT